MLGWIKRRVRNEQIKMARQNALAAQYLDTFRKTSEAVLGSSLFHDQMEMIRETSERHLESLRGGSDLPTLLATDCIDANKYLRRQYEGILHGQRAFSVKFGTAREPLLNFDQRFVPNEGWGIYLSHFGK